jgi:hypothetical protein
MLVLLSLTLITPQVFAFQDNKPAKSGTEQKTEPEKQPAPAKQESTENADKVKTPEIERSKISIAEPAPSSDQMAKDIQHYLRASDIKTMLSGTDDFITLFSDSTTSINKGVAIVIPDWQQSATNPKAINALRMALPAQGWTTIVVQPPSQPERYPVNPDQTDAEQKNEELLTSYQELLSAMLVKVMEQAANYPGIFIVIAQGNNGALALDLYQQKRNKAPSALILLSGYRYTESEQDKFSMQIASSEIPVLDLYLSQDHPLVLSQVAKRKAKANKELKVFYRQQKINNLATGYYPEPDLLAAIMGWLRSIGW